MAYGKAMTISTQREIQLLCLHEVAWCHVIRLDYSQAHDSFARLQNESRWCESVYAYLSAVCAGANAKSNDILKTYKQIMIMIDNTTKITQLDTFVSRRATKLIDQNECVHSPVYYKMLVYEILYLWNAMSSCCTEALQEIITGKIILIF